MGTIEERISAPIHLCGTERYTFLPWVFNIGPHVSSSISYFIAYKSVFKAVLGVETRGVDRGAKTIFIHFPFY